MSEILAPCGNAAALEAAVKSGADAVYFGASGFNARQNAENFDREGLKNAVRYCRSNGVKCHITLNTLLHDDEIPAALETAAFAVLCGADALIVQDIGIISLLKKALPDTPLHASTQMTIHNKSGVISAKKLGISRVVLSRELSLSEIREICKTARDIDMETEVFVHGSLCMSMSGQCYLSAMLGGRSGNRGLCAQPCRLPFSAHGGTGYDLSLKDMSHLDFLRELKNAGVSSFKIEGRMKDPEYVAAAVTAAREALCFGEVGESTKNLLCSVFSRSGFTDGYINGKRTVDMFGIRRNSDLKASKEVQRSVHNLYRREFQRIPVRFYLTLKNGCPAELSADDGENRVTVYSDCAGNIPFDSETARQKLSRCGGTPFFMSSLAVNAENGTLISFAALGELRRKVLEKLQSAREIPPKRKIQNIDLPSPCTIPNKKPAAAPEVYARFNNTLPKNLSHIDKIYLTADSGDYLFERALKSCKAVGAELPRTLFENEDALIRRLEYLKNLGVKYALCENIYAIEIAKSLDFVADGGAFLQICNSEAAKSAESLGLKSITLSFENTLLQSEKILCPVKKGITVYGYLPLMLTRCCPLKNGRDCKGCSGDYITDRKGVRFFVKCRNGASEIFNSVPLSLFEEKDKLRGFDFNLLYFTNESAEKSDDIISRFISGKKLNEEFTRGLYFRGVK